MRLLPVSWMTTAGSVVCDWGGYESFRGIRRITRHDRQHLAGGRLHWQSVFSPGYPIRISKSTQDLMLMFDPRIIGITVRSNDVAVLVDTEHVRKTEILAPLVPFRIHACFERRQQRTACIHVGFELSALLITEKSCIRQDQSLILIKILPRRGRLRARSRTGNVLPGERNRCRRCIAGCCLCRVSCRTTECAGP